VWMSSASSHVITPSIRGSVPFALR
jgi:hypothetical protein